MEYPLSRRHFLAVSGACLALLGSSARTLPVQRAPVERNPAEIRGGDEERLREIAARMDRIFAS